MRRAISASLVALAGSVLFLSSTSGATAVPRNAPSVAVAVASRTNAASGNTQSVSGEVVAAPTLPVACSAGAIARVPTSEKASSVSGSLPAIQPSSSGASGSVLMSPYVVDEADNGDTIDLTVGQSFVLELASAQWCVTVTDPAVLVEENVPDASGIIEDRFQAVAPGMSAVVAVGHFPPCQPSPRVCFLPALPVFRMTVIVSDPGVRAKVGARPRTMIQGDITQADGSTVVVGIPAKAVHCPSHGFCPAPIVAPRPISVDLARATFFTDSGQSTERPSLVDGELLTATGSFTDSEDAIFDAAQVIVGSVEG